MDFFTNYRSPKKLDERGQEVKADNGDLKYAKLIIDLRNGAVSKLDIELDDVLHYPGGDALVVAAEGNAKRHLELAYSAVDDILKATRREGERPFSRVDASSDKHALYMAHRIVQAEKALADQVERGLRPEHADVLDYFPSMLTRTYELRFVPRTSSMMTPLALRNVRGEHLGKLVTVKAIVLRASDVKAALELASYTWCVVPAPLPLPSPYSHPSPSPSPPLCPCSEVCGYELFQPVTGKTFMPVPACISATCTTNGTQSRVAMQTRASIFVKFQELRVQELPEQVPVGHIPRSMSVHARGEVTRSVNAGDVVIISGIFLPTPYTGYQAMKAGLTADTFLEAQYLQRTKKTNDENIDKATQDAISALLEKGRPYEELANSIAPEIFGHEYVKRALLLQLMGGTSTQQKDGMKTRGDLNICLMGDPGVAKSQLLKHISRAAPRAVYTTGKGSSGVGLTAAVVRDPMTNEMTLEGGALVLADMGICCIDEFDKMEESDRTAIHEVMEQQTVSIAKAGITTTLNARTAILAAANPKYGRWNPNADRDPHVAMMKNINLPAALLSRFDLVFLLLDKVDKDADKALAEHITYVHQHETTAPDAMGEGQTRYPPAFIRQYISVAKNIKSHVPQALTEYIVESYVTLRAQDKERAESQHSKSTTTARQLLSILRLAEARARLHFREEVDKEDVDEALNLIKMSVASVMDDNGKKEQDSSDTKLSNMFFDTANRAVGGQGAYASPCTAPSLALRAPSLTPPPLPQSTSRSSGRSQSEAASPRPTSTSSSPRTWTTCTCCNSTPAARCSWPRDREQETSSLPA